MDSIIDLKNAPTDDIVDEIMDRYFTALFIPQIPSICQVSEVREISILTVIKELEDDPKFIKSIMHYAKQGLTDIRFYYWKKARELCVDLVQQAKDDYYYE